MKVRVWSDLHFEINGRPGIINEKVEPGELLVLAGDIICARYLQKNRNDHDSRSHCKALKFLCDVIFPKFEKIVYIMGNHEHYGFDINDSAELIRQTVRNYYPKDNFHLLENEITSFKDFDIYGCTLWTSMTGPLDKFNAENGMNDYRLIRNGNFRLTADHTQMVFNNSIKMMTEWMDIPSDRKKIIVTHHVPSSKSLNSNHVGNALDCAYASNLEDVMIHYKPSLWVHGHTHECVDYMVDQTRVYANQYGYQSYGEKTSFDLNKDIEI